MEKRALYKFQDRVSKQLTPHLLVRLERDGKKKKRDNERATAKREKTQKGIKREEANKGRRDG